MTERDTAELIKWAAIGVGLYFVYKAVSGVNNAINAGESAISNAVSSGTAAVNAGVDSTANDLSTGAWNWLSLVP